MILTKEKDTHLEACDQTHITLLRMFDVAHTAGPWWWWLKYLMSTFFCCLERKRLESSPLALYRGREIVYRHKQKAVCY